MERGVAFAVLVVAELVLGVSWEMAWEALERLLVLASVAVSQMVRWQRDWWQLWVSVAS